MKNIKKPLIEWGIMIGIFGVLYFTGLHTVVIGKLQQAVLATGLFKAELKEEKDAPGQPSASYNMVLKSGSGEILDLRNQKGKVLFINFWATWCPPCIAEMPGINSLYDKINSDEVKFLMISRDQNFDKAKDFVKKKGFSFPVYRLQSPVPEVFQSQTIPTTFIVSKKGKIVVTHQGMAKYNDPEMEQFILDLAKSG